MKILIVDDDSLVLEILGMYLVTIDFENIHFAESGQQALKAIEASQIPFDCILLDISMPKMTGIELIPHLREVKGYAETPIIMMTALYDRKYIASAFVAGAFDYITKPFEFFELETKLQLAQMQLSNQIAEPAGALGSGASVDQQVKDYCAKQGPQPGEHIPESGLISERAFENCLHRMKAETKRHPTFITLQIREFTKQAVQYTPEEQKGFMIHLARNIRDEIKCVDGITTYIGDGTFLAMSFADPTKSKITLAEAVQQAVLETSKQNNRQAYAKLAVSDIAAHEEPSEAEASYLIYAAKKYVSDRIVQSGQAQ